MRWTALCVLAVGFVLSVWGCASVNEDSVGTDTDVDTDTDGDTDSDSDTDSDTDTDSDGDTDTDSDTDTDTELCGNNTVDSPELCDGTDLDGQGCGGFGFADGGVLECGDDCDEFVLDDCVGGCGNNTQEGSETCDGTDLVGQDCTDFGYSGGVLDCDTDCQDFNTGSCSDGCGNDTVETGEICDGTDLNGESCTTLGFSGGTLGCSAICDSFDLTGCTGGCGNAVQEAGEDCDGADLNSQLCTTQGYYSGTLGCDSSCNFDFGSCSGTCGDDTADISEGETCDGTDLAGQDCTDFGFYSGTLLCNGACSGYISAGCSGFCGDNTADTGEGEICDGTDLNGNSCVTEGYYGGSLTCNAGCNGFFYSSCTGYCGDSIVQASEGEECDNSNLNGNSCSTAAYYYGTPSCDSNCGMVYSACWGQCGDGTLDTSSPASEVCDGTNFGGLTCADYGFTSGYLVCNAGCGSIDSSNCYGTCSISESENFESAFPGTWSIVDGGDLSGGTNTWFRTTTQNTFSPVTMSGYFMRVDSDDYGDGYLMDESILTEQFTVGGCATGTVSFSSYYHNLGGDNAQFDIRTNLNTSWTTLANYTTDDTALTTRSFSVSSYISGATWVQFRWRYDDNDEWAWFWYVDDFSFTAP